VSDGGRPESRRSGAKTPRAPPLSMAQCRMARDALGLTVRDLASRAKVSTNTITRLERGEALGVRKLGIIRTALEAAGVEFIDEDGGGPGVRLRRNRRLVPSNHDRNPE
jgi:transcriptional regulator with XRE-family HTH domain